MPHHTRECLCAKKKNKKKTLLALRSEAASGIADQGGGSPFDWVEGKGTCEQGRIHAVATNRGVVARGDSRVECTLTCVCVCVPERARTELQIMRLGRKLSLPGTDSLRHFLSSQAVEEWAKPGHRGTYFHKVLLRTFYLSVS